MQTVEDVRASQDRGSLARSGSWGRAGKAAPAASPAAMEDALKSTTYAYANGAGYQQVGAYATSFDKGTGLVDVVAAATALRG